MSTPTKTTTLSAGKRLRETMANSQVVPFIGVYDVFSASIAGQHFNNLFVSGFSFAASHYGLPDVGFITWTDIVDFVRRINTVLPTHNLLVDIDDGYCDPEVACHVVSVLEAAGAAGVVLEDQKRPRRCGHFEGKQIMELDEYLAKLRAVLATRRDMVVIARTDTSDPDDMVRRVLAFAEAGADAVLIDGLPNLDVVREVSQRVGRPFGFNQIAGGKSPAYTMSELSDAGISMIIYSTPCLFAAQAAVENAMTDLKTRDGTLAGNLITVPDCNGVLKNNLARRDTRN
jgi:2-methylisocitrate lyase-like PEP mutase family enzyme